MLYAHRSDLYHELKLRHALTNCFVALMGVLLLDGDIDTADRVDIPIYNGPMVTTSSKQR